MREHGPVVAMQINNTNEVVEALEIFISGTFVT
jgi:hypothetical protein